MYGRLVEPFLVDGIRITDTETKEDMTAIGKILAASDNLRFLAGCAGFADVLPGILPFPSAEKRKLPAANGLLVVSGSITKLAEEQTSFGETIGWSVITLTDAQKTDPAYVCSAEGLCFAEQIAQELQAGKRIILRTLRPEAYKAEGPEADRERIADHIGMLTAAVLQRTEACGLVVFGGDTLYAITKRMNIDSVIPISEISPGVVASAMLREKEERLLITKSGGFGKPDVLKEIDAFFVQNRWERKDADAIL
jgi:uncharacterized protein YgbK (DUF1537 family)